jgi:hypothetical protein
VYVLVVLKVENQVDYIPPVLLCQLLYRDGLHSWRLFVDLILEVVPTNNFQVHLHQYLIFRNVDKKESKFFVVVERYP